MNDALTPLAAICGDGFARAGGPADAVGGIAARWVAAPGSAKELADVLRLATDEGLAVVVRGAGTKLDWGAPPRAADILVDTGRFVGVPEHAAGDLVATVGAGTPLRAAQAVLASAGQRIALDPASPAATLGGVLATGEAGPSRVAFGTPRDLLIGVEFVRADGVVAHSGGRVVKNVAGYDVGKLLCGSFGTLGVIVSATLRLHPLPAASAWVIRSVSGPAEARDLVGAMLASSLVPAAVEVDYRAGGGGTLTTMLEGSESGVATRAAAAAALLGGEAAVVGQPPRWWGSYPFHPGDTALKLVAPIADLPTVVAELVEASGGAAPVRGSAGVGVVYAALPAALPPDRVCGIVAAVRAAAAECGGSCTVLRAPPAVRDCVDGWGPVPGVALMRRVKEQFDPAGTLAPGRMAGGI